MRAKLVGAAVGGFLAGLVLIGFLGRDPADEGAARPETSSPATPATESSSGPSSSATVPGPTTSGPPSIDPGVLLVWTSGGLPARFDAAVAGIDAVEHISTVSGEQLDLTRVVAADGSMVEEHRDGWAIPLDVLAVDPTAHAPFAPSVRSSLGELSAGQALLTDSSAGLRGVGVGARLEVRGGAVEIVGIVDDLTGAGAEMIVHVDDRERLGVTTPRYILVRHHGDRDAIQRAIDAALDELDASEPIRFRTPAETTWLRHGDAVLPAVVVKTLFGEFAYRDRGGGSVEISPSWIEDNIVTVDLPVVGPVSCHAEMVAALEPVIDELTDTGLEFLVDPAQVAGCFAPRRIDGSLALSRHTWGIAIDLNVGDNPRGSFSTQDPRLVELMREGGFGWGGAWLVPDPAHYELLGAP